MSIIKIILVDDHRLIRDGIKSLLADTKNIDVIDEASDGYDLMEKLKHKIPDIILLDISLPKISGLDVITLVNNNYPQIKILILSMFINEDYVFNAIKAGASGYMHKNTTKKELLEAIYKINDGQNYFSDSVSGIILKSYIRKAQTGDNYSEKEEKTLSRRELEILKLFAEGHTNQEIADKLFISIRTVESHKNHIMTKLELRSTVDLIKFAIKNNIIEI